MSRRNVPLSVNSLSPRSHAILRRVVARSGDSLSETSQFTKVSFFVSRPNAYIDLQWWIRAEITITIFLNCFEFVLHSRSPMPPITGDQEQTPRTLPKNGEFCCYSVGLCRLEPCNIVLFRPLLNLTIVVSIKSRVSRGAIIAGMRFAL